MKMENQITIQVPAAMKAMYECRLPVETTEQQAMVLGIAKKVYTKARNSRLHYEVIEEMGMKIRQRDWFYLSMTFSKPGLIALAKGM